MLDVRDLHHNFADLLHPSDLEVGVVRIAGEI